MSTAMILPLTSFMNAFLQGPSTNPVLLQELIINSEAETCNEGKTQVGYPFRLCENLLSWFYSQ